MPSFPEFTFTQCISEQHFTSKPSKEALNNITFRPCVVTINRLLDYACHGGIFSPFCRSNSADGSFHIKLKDQQHFASSSTVFYDFDGMETPMQEFIQELPYKPSFGYTSYSNGMEGCGYRFRLGYVFNHPIVGNKNYRELYCAIRNANNFPVKTNKSGGLDELREEQCYFGTNTKAETYNAGYYYSVSEFEEFRPVMDAHALGQRAVQNVSASVEINPEFLKDFRTLTTADFSAKYSKQFGWNYYTSSSTPLIMDESGMFFTFPDYYVAVRHRREGKRILKWDKDQDRRNKIFWTAQIMLYNNPDLTIENLLYNLRLERDRFYVDNEGKVNNEYLLYVAQRSMRLRYTPNPTKHGEFRINPDYWDGLGVNHHAAANIVRGYNNAINKVKPFINPYVGIKENLQILHDNGVSLREGKLISESTLKRMVTKGFIQINQLPLGTPHPDLIECTDNVTISESPIKKGILELLRTDGNMKQQDIADALNVSKRTVIRYMKEMEGTAICREGNNRSGRWVVIDS